VSSDKAQIRYESNVAKMVKNAKTLEEMALKEIGMFLRREIRLKTKRSTVAKRYMTKKGTIATVRPGTLQRSIGYWFRKKEQNLQIGSKAFYAAFFELGTSKQSKDPFLSDVVMNNISNIRQIAGKYIKRIAEENIIMGITDKGDGPAE
jgi:HK97 gp10 family phage protein